ncbi:immunoglobulin superfamily DCC subclass member 4-like isoform X2 [Brienomyrus brachyistius]|uniref:immunoglobulin superfamily DCC subclass member 4-like isoform X2 n=1 Tax=Brienomyrus brachyistius TaxID=42636 RepID=UPI0020B41BC9|nr:immunoglobulin superfamily DCC subclass member 4-like isoform X2 [Brienomyrus brachyistius]
MDKRSGTCIAMRSICLLWLLSLDFCDQHVQARPVSLELSCGVGPVHVVLESGRPLLLDCHQGATDMPRNVTWLQGGAFVRDAEAVSVLPNGSLLVRPDKGPAAEGDYSCVSAGPFGALTSRKLTLRLSGLSRFHQHPRSQTVPVGGLARFQCQVDGLPVPNITWERNDDPLPLLPRYTALPNGVLQISGVQEEDVGSYRCVASNAANRRLSRDATLTITPGHITSLEEVLIAVPPQNTTVVLGRTTVMECMAQGQPKPFVSWSRMDARPISTDVVVQQTNLVIPDTRSHHAGVYVCRANRPKTRQFVLAAAELRVLAPPVILRPPDTVSLSRGNTARFVCNASGEPAPSLRWFQNGAPVQPNGRVKSPAPGVLLVSQLAVADAGYYQCLASNSLGTACATAKLTVVVREGLPSAPRLLTVTAHSSSTALLSWQRPEHNSEQIIGFSVHYQQNEGADIREYQFAVNNDTTEFYVKELLPHTAYTFYVVAYSPMGASRPSLPVTITMLEDVPVAPPPLSLLSTSPTDIHVMWLPLSPELSRGTITRYRVDYCALDKADLVSSVEVAANETQVTLRRLNPGQIYRLRVVAGTGAGYGPPSEWTLHCTPDLFNYSNVFHAPTGLKVRAKASSLDVTWQPSPNHTHVSGYRLYCREVLSDTKDTMSVELRKTAHRYEIRELAPDQLYEVRVQAYSERRDGYSAVWRGRTQREPAASGGPPPDAFPPPPPSSIRASANSSTSIWLRWDRPRAGGSPAVHHYTVRCSPAGLRNASLVSYFTSTAQEILLDALRPSTRYELAVQSNGLEEAGPFSGTVEESTLPDRPSTPPVELQLSALDSSTVLVSWRPPVEPNGIIVEYRILYSSSSTQPDHLWSSMSLDGSTISTEVQMLLGDTRYYFKMAALTEVGAGPYSPIKDVHTPPAGHELDVPTVTGILLGVSLGLLCIILCVCFSLRGHRSRKMLGGMDSSPLALRYPQSEPALHELETLMSAGTKDPAITAGQQSLMGRDVHREGLMQASLSPEREEKEGVNLPTSSAQVDAEVIIHRTPECQGRPEADVETEASLDCKLSPGGSQTSPTPTSPVGPKLGPDPRAVQPPDPSLAEASGSHDGHHQGGGCWEQHSPSFYRARLIDGFHSLMPPPNGSSLSQEHGRFPPLSAQASPPSSPASSSGPVHAFAASHCYP